VRNQGFNATSLQVSSPSAARRPKLPKLRFQVRRRRQNQYGSAHGDGHCPRVERLRQIVNRAHAA